MHVAVSACLKGVIVGADTDGLDGLAGSAGATLSIGSPLVSDDGSGRAHQGTALSPTGVLEGALGLSSHTGGDIGRACGRGAARGAEITYDNEQPVNEQ